MKRIDDTEPGTIRYRFRKKRFALIEGLIRDLLATGSDPVRILDIGGTARYWSLLDPSLRAHVAVTLLNRQSELDSHRAELDIAFEEVVGDGCSMPQYADCAFDLAHSNSVIEHVGSYGNMIRFAAETRRTGRAYYVQTPYLWFPLEPHYGVPFVHWLPDALRLQLHSRVSVGYAGRCGTYADAMHRIDGTRIVDKTLMRALFPDGRLERERFMLMTKSLICLRRPEQAAGGDDGA